MKNWIYLLLSLLVIISCTNNEPTSDVNVKKDIDQKIKNIEINECNSNSDCVIGGCSGTVCNKKGKDIMTTCEYMPEYECYKLIKCGCVDNKCQWEKNAQFERCLEDNRLN